jgi:peptidoglycan/xylan/chitin deacetylase (PgdA/CDA1 family)
MTSVVRRLAGGPVGDGVVDVLERMPTRRHDHLAVLTFHRVVPAGSEVAPGLHSATPAGLDELLARLVRRHAVIGMRDLLDRMDGRAALPPRSVLLTFDDAYIDFATHAWPVLRAHGLPATLFVPTAYPDAPERSFWWDRLYRAVLRATRPTIDGPDGPLPITTDAQRQDAYRRLRDSLKALDHDELVDAVDRLVETLGAPEMERLVLGWSALQDLQRDGVVLAPHTRTHPLLTRLDPARQDAELAGSREDLAERTGSEMPVLAYPAGATSADVAARVGAAGYQIAFTTERGTNDLQSASRLLLRRINVSVRTPASLIRAQALR